MTERRDDADIARLERRLADAKTELAEVRQRGTDSEPLLADLRQHLGKNQFAARLWRALEESRRPT